MSESLGGIVPRWEWRTFADSFGEADARFDALTPDLVRESNETYVLSLDSDSSVKIRDGLGTGGRWDWLAAKSCWAVFSEDVFSLEQG